MGPIFVRVTWVRENGEEKNISINPSRVAFVMDRIDGGCYLILEGGKDMQIRQDRAAFEALVQLEHQKATAPIYTGPSWPQYPPNYTPPYVVTARGDGFLINADGTGGAWI